jgi:Zn-finger nucleic acid-binding protein
MRLLSTLISREREYLADAAAVEIGRAPEALARAIYKAHVKNSFIGAFSSAYSPLFIVPPDSREITEGLASRIINTHPPVMKRIRVLADMAGKSPAAVIDAVRESAARRDEAREILRSGEEAGIPPAGEGTSSGLHDEARIWSLGLSADKWEGPFTIGEILCHPRFSLLRPVHNAQEKVEAKAREFPQIRAALRRISEKKPLRPERDNLCPRCRVPLAETFYEGVAVRSCGKCGGRLVDMAGVDKIVARREVAFSADLLEKARRFREKVLLNPLKKQKINTGVKGAADCPACGYKMVARPYNYQYFVPVDKCLSCSRIWFDTDELEILQILIESR